MKQLVLAMTIASMTIYFINNPPEEKQSKLTQEKIVDNSIDGIWHCSGTQGDGKYEGVVTITQIKNTYVVQWLVGDGHTIGVGQRNGDMLSVGWTTQRGQTQVRGISTYKINGKTLVGQYHSLPGPGVGQVETLRFLKRFGIRED